MSKYIDIINKGTVHNLKTNYEQNYVDTVQVVRCKDCKWFGDIGCAIRIVDDSDRPSENDFCSFAERKDRGNGMTQEEAAKIVLKAIKRELMGCENCVLAQNCNLENDDSPCLDCGAKMDEVEE